MSFTIADRRQIGWIGTGVMGQSMCRHLLAQGYPITLTTRTKRKAEQLIRQGARWVDSPDSVARQSHLIFTMVGFPQDVRDVYFGPRGLFSGARPHSVLVDLTTSSPQLAQEIYETGKAKGLFALDAPVSGGDVGAREARLSFMVGGDREVLESVRPALEIMGKNIVYQGGAGSGQHTKLCNQIVIAGTMIGVCESLLYGFAAGLNMETMMQSIRGGAAGCWTLEHLAPRILRRDFDPGFFVEHFIKDMELVLEEASRRNLSLPGLTLVHRLYRSLSEKGHGRSGTHALYLALEELAQTTLGNHPYVERDDNHDKQQRNTP